MILASLKDGGRDGTLLVVDKERRNAVRAGEVVGTLQDALDHWSACEVGLRRLSHELDQGRRMDAFMIDPAALAAPLPRAYAFYDAACYPEHISVIRAARGATLPADFLDQPLMYQAVASPMMGPRDAIELPDDEALGVDLEAELVVITGEVPRGTPSAQAGAYIRLIGLLNDVSLRQLVAPELGRGFGFLQSKPESAMGPFVVTPDELEGLWNGRKFTGGRYRIQVRGDLLGDLDPGQDVAFDYADLIAHAARTRTLVAGSIVGAGTLANADRKRGNGCIAELRAREQLADGEARTPYLRFGDEVVLELFDAAERSVFGAIRQTLVRSRPERVGEKRDCA